MSAASIDRAANDPDLRKRVDALIYKIMSAEPEKAESEFGRRIRFNPGMVNAAPYYAVAVATEADYEAAIQAGRGAPGHDADIISDEEIIGAIKAYWPADTTVTTPFAQNALPPNPA